MNDFEQKKEKHEVSSPFETRKCAREFASQLAPGAVVFLSGDLGAGKTEFVKGCAEFFECAEQVTSPSFSLLNEYQGSMMPLYHMDLYRIEDESEIYRAGLDECVEKGGITFIEWAEKWADSSYLTPIYVRISNRDHQNRTIEISFPENVKGSNE